MCVRGLKLNILIFFPRVLVARRVRAWIETDLGKNNPYTNAVARRVRAWIETFIPS